MTFDECLKEHMECYSDKPAYLEMYRGYPRPTESVWQECIDGHSIPPTDEHYSLHCFMNYEMILESQGIKTVGYDQFMNCMFCGETSDEIDLAELERQIELVM